MLRRRFMSGIALPIVAVLALGTAVRAMVSSDRDDEKAPAAQDATVQFAMPQPQTPGANNPGTPANSSTHFLLPDDVTIRKGGTVTFVVNGGGHGIAIHPVSKNTTRQDIAEDLCDGSTPELADPAADRVARFNSCNGTIVTKNVMIADGVKKDVTGTQNLQYLIKDGKNNLIIDTGFNVNFPADSTTPAIVKDNPRVDDALHTHRVLATSGASPGDTRNPPAFANNRAGAFLTGTGFNAAGAPTVGNRIQVRFEKIGRYLVICMNRSHALNDHMFGFVNVVGDDGEDK